MNDKNRRIELLRYIHAAKRRVGLDDDAYREMLKRITSKTSCAAMDEPELRKVFAEFNNRAGDSHESSARPVATNAAAHGSEFDREAMFKKMMKLSYIITSPPDGAMGDKWAMNKYLQGAAERMFGTRGWKMLTGAQCHKLIAALQAHINRRDGKC